jgi:hypothetical protein
MPFSGYGLPRPDSKYLHSEHELRSVAGNLRELDHLGIKRAHVIFNNCYQNFGIMNASTMGGFRVVDRSPVFLLLQRRAVRWLK